jgi:hypothetical protein
MGLKIFRRVARESRIAVTRDYTGGRVANVLTM